MSLVSNPKETCRINNLKSYEILDSDSDTSFNAITALAAQLCHCPIAFISMIDENRQWFKSKIGFDAIEISMRNSICSYTIQSPDKPTIFSDLEKDPRFENCSLFAAVPNIRFYAGVPIVSQEGYCIGTLCVMDHKPRRITLESKEMLVILTAQISDLMALYKSQNDLFTFSKLADQSTNMVAILDHTFNYEYVNPMFVMRSGYALAEILGKSASEILIGPETDLLDLESLLSAAKRRERMEHEICLQEKSGGTFWVKISISPVFDDHHNLRKYIGVLVDITDFKRKQIELIEAKENAQEAVKMKAHFLSNMSHEIRTPMNGIIGLSDITLNDKGLSSKNRELITHIKYSAESLLSVLNDILDFSKMNAEKLTFEKINFDLSKIFDHLQGSLGLQANQKGIDFKVRLDRKMPSYVSGDPGRLNQILRNIVGNAVKFTEIGGIDIDVNLLEFNTAGPLVEIIVSDTGIGIPENKLKSIFNVFEQANDYTASKYGGTGLGMSIAQSLVEKYNGELTLKSQLGVGTSCRFTIQLSHPIIEDLDNTAALTPVESELENDQFRILVADDNVMNQIITRDMLENMGYQLDVVEDGKECVEKYKEGHYDLILMDVQMPVMNGLDATREIRSLNSEIPILAMTASVMDHDKVKCFEAGMNCTVPKPINTADLKAIIADYLVKGTRNGSAALR